jgi:hypothetical protein
MFTCLLISLIYYPIFCCITSRSRIGYVLGTVYCWLFGAYFVVFNLPRVCQDEATEDSVSRTNCWLYSTAIQRRYIINIARKLPGFIFIVFICFATTWQSIRSLLLRQNDHEVFVSILFIFLSFNLLGKLSTFESASIAKTWNVWNGLQHCVQYASANRMLFGFLNVLLDA